MDTLQVPRKTASESKTAAKGPAAVKTIPEAEPSRSIAVPWLVAALVVMTAAFAVLALLTFVPRFRPTDPVRLVDQTVATWDSGPPSDLSALYARDAVLVHADGTKISGIGAIVADAKSVGRGFMMTRTGDVSVSADGTYAAATYRYAGAGRGSGLLVLKIEDGKVVRQWSYDLP